MLYCIIVHIYCNNDNFVFDKRIIIKLDTVWRGRIMPRDAREDGVTVRVKKWRKKKRKRERKREGG